MKRKWSGRPEGETREEQRQRIDANRAAKRAARIAAINYARGGRITQCPCCGCAPCDCGEEPVIPFVK